jgi:hypothetical protein
VWEIQSPLILDLGIRWGEWSESRPGRVYPPPPVTHWISGLTGHRAGLDIEAKEKHFASAGIEPRSSNLRPDTTVTEVPQLQAKV